ncbi:ATP-binding protein [Deinococcus knuensis]|uniref:histidine kinase n=1 Tax=Deinococcus knuensis TaxID=1837380 RepID=A0ABQ2SD43_9DEIO|nr:ATP-binding protein [Deinococcus knuensis]GGS21910.1 histidine kinase [Deinococcus knuensis]
MTGHDDQAPGAAPPALAVQVARLGEPVDLTNCDREPIHIPGAVQPHGVLLVLRGDVAVQVSGNTGAHFGLSVNDVLSGGLEVLLDPPTLSRVRAALDSEPLRDNPLYLLSTPVCGRGLFDLIAHRRGEQLILEFEAARAGRPPVDSYSQVKRSVARLNATLDLGEFAVAAAEEVRRLTGFDRVMVYQFAEDGTGTVIAENVREDMTPYLGLRYPASDIPQQARALYVQNMLRIIADVTYDPVPMFARQGEGVPDDVAAPLDMSYCVLRSVSPIHLQYLKNMGVHASMSISLVRGGALWGLIACHHNSPRHLPYDVRSACELLGQVASVQISARQEQRDQSYQLQLKTAQTQLVERMAEESDLLEALVGSGMNLLHFIDAPGAAVCLDGEVVLLGATPSRTQVMELGAWLDTQAEVDILHTQSLGELHAPAQAYAARASGLLAVKLSRSRHDYVMWFRPEELQTVTWGGDPNKPVEVSEDGTERLTPRQSFAAWQQTVRGRSAAWQSEELVAARALRRAIMAVVLRRVEELGRLNEHLERSNADLERSNADLDAFAYIASHDLKEPLRGLHNYSAFLLETYEQQLDEDGAAKLRTLVRLTQRMDDLIDSLLLYSRVGRVDLSFRPTDLNDLLVDVLEVIAPRLEQLNVQVQVQPDLPTLTIDRVRVGEVLSNLITNAMKYNDKAQPQVQVGAVRAGERDRHPDLRVPDGVPAQAHVLFVRDNGIGIREKHFENIFRIFKRLHARDQFGGGTGAGLTIVRKIVERHGGQIWVSSEYGQGSVFYFTLEA